MTTRIRRGVAGRRARIAMCAGGVLGGLALLVSALSAGASAGTTIGVGSGAISSVGQTVTVPVTVTLAAADSNMIAYDINLTWNSSFLSASYPSDVTAGSGFQLISGSSGAGQIEVTAGAGALGGGGIPCTAGVACTLFTITFHGVGGGSTSVQSVGKQPPFHTMSDGSGTDIEPSSFGSGTITVGSGSATATNTPSNTSTATNTPTGTITASPTGTSTNTPTPTSTGTNTPTPTSTGTATPTPTGTPHPSGFRYVVPQVAKDGAS